MWKKQFFRFSMLAAGVFFICIVIYPVSCSFSEEGITLVTLQSSSPVIKSFVVESDNKISMEFDKKVTVKESVVFSATECLTRFALPNENFEEGVNSVKFSMAENLPVGAKYDLYGVVEDETGNTLTFCIPFIGYNSKIPELILSEIHPKYSKSSLGFYKSEYIELFIKSDGNLSGLQIISGYDGISKLIELPSVEVHKDEYVVVHLRNKGEGCISELDDNLSLSTAKYSSDTARDIWIENENAVLGDDRDVVVIKNSQTNEIIAGVMYASNVYNEWKTDFMKNLAEELLSSGFWESDGTVLSAVDCTGITATKSIQRCGSGNNSQSWNLSGTSGETPGY